MSSEIRRYADQQDTQTLKYIFLDSLDVDPTFETYQEDFEYCCQTTDILEPHQNLTPFQVLPDAWNEPYWARLKTDLKKNFSRERFDHMRRVASVLFAEKIERIRTEQENETVPPDSGAPSPLLSGEEQETRSIEPEVAEHHQNVREEQERSQRESRENEEKKRLFQTVQSVRSADTKETLPLKKVVGIVITALLTLAFLALLLRLWWSNPR